MDRKQACILALGQSDVANHGPERANGGPQARVFHEGSFLPAIDPLPGASGAGGSVWTRLAPRLISNSLYQEVILVLAAYGGTAISDWVPGGSFHARLLPTLDAAAKAGVRFTHVVWHQGERDTLMATSGARYRECLESIVLSLRDRDIEAPVFICQASYRFGQTNAGIRAAQQEIVNAGRQIYAGPDTDILGAEFRSDDTYLNAGGQDRFAGMLVDAFAAAEPQQAAHSNG